MAIPNFKEFLSKALDDDKQTLKEFLIYTKEATFSAEEISYMLETLKHQESGPSYYLTALLYQYGVGYERNLTIASENHNKAIELKYTEGVFELALMYFNHEIKDYVVFNTSNHHPDPAIPLYFKAKKALSTDQQQEAMTILDKAIEINPKFAEAIVNRAELHENSATKEELYSRAVDLGHYYTIKKQAQTLCCGANRDFRAAQDLYKRGGLNSLCTELCLEINENVQLIDRQIEHNLCLRNLVAEIDNMYSYGSKIGAEKGKIVKDHAKNLRRKLDNFILDLVTAEVNQVTREQLSTFQGEFISLLHSKDAEMEHHREAWKPILANIFIALTGIGLFAIIIKTTAHLLDKTKDHFSMNRALLFAYTHTQKLATEIVKEAKELLPFDFC